MARRAIAAPLVQPVLAPAADIGCRGLEAMRRGGLQARSAAGRLCSGLHCKLRRCSASSAAGGSHLQDAVLAVLLRQPAGHIWRARGRCLLQAGRRQAVRGGPGAPQARPAQAGQACQTAHAPGWAEPACVAAAPPQTPSLHLSPRRCPPPPPHPAARAARRPAGCGQRTQRTAASVSGRRRRRRRQPLPPARGSKPRSNTFGALVMARMPGAPCGRACSRQALAAGGLGLGGALLKLTSCQLCVAAESQGGRPQWNP